jgi:3-methylcrotonyl-CoA carboxylase alpha subunit
MGAAAVRIAKAAKYINAGTMEFMLDVDRHFYFLEMNTRLQVEHPVTECVTGLDLVRHQICIAAGEPLGLTQEQISSRGHAIEVRIYAEDPEQNFLPSTGVVTRFVKPEGPGIRVDSGIENGDEITQYYDPMIAKLIVYGEARPAAIARLQRALEQTAIFGVTTNVSLLHDIAMHPAFREGLTHTNFLNAYQLLSPKTPADIAPPNEVLVAAALYEVSKGTEIRTLSNGYIQPVGTASLNPWQTLGPWRIVGEARTLTYRSSNLEYKVTLRRSVDDRETWQVQIDSQPAETVTCTIGNDNLLLLQRGAAQVRTHVQEQKDEIRVILDGHSYRLERRQPPDVDVTSHGGTASHSQKTLTAPMAGTIVKVQVHPGDSVQAHQALVILSAMKMEHAITAPYEGKVRRVNYREGDVVKGGAVVVEME